MRGATCPIRLPSFRSRPASPVTIFYGEQISNMADVLERLKILIDSSTPIVVMETVEEMRVVRTVRAACAALNLAAYEWSIASGLVRCGANLTTPDFDGPMPPGGYQNSTVKHAAEQDTQALYNSREPAQMLSNLQGISVEAVFILKDLHRHMDEAVVVRRLRDVGQQFSANRRTVVLTGPKIDIPPELGSLVEFVELPLPDRTRLRQIIDETLVRVGRTRTLQRKLNGEWAGSHRRKPARSHRGRSRARDFSGIGGKIRPLPGNSDRCP